MIELRNEYRTKINTETISELAKKRAEISNKCAKAAAYCVAQSTAHHKRFHLVAAFLAINGISMDPFNSECHDILIKLFNVESESAETAIINEHHKHIEEKTILKQLVERDTHNGWARDIHVFSNYISK